MKISLSLSISLTLHLLVLFLIFQNSSKSGGFENPGTEKQGIEKNEASGRLTFKGVDAPNVLERQKVMEVEIVEVPASDGDAPTKTQKPKVEECPGKSYNGIGVQLAFDTINKVFKGYPAEAAGLEVGDVIVWADGEMLGDQGTALHLRIQRGTEIIEKTVIRGKVCY